MTRIEIELCQEDRARLDAILAALQTCGTPYSAPVAAQDAAETTEAEAVPVSTPEEETPTAETVAPQPTVSHADIQRKVVTLSAAGKKAEVREIVTKYAKKVSDLPEDKLVEVMDKLTALEG